MRLRRFSVTINPSCSRTRIASRTGVRLTPTWLASSSSETVCRGLSSMERIFALIFS